MTTTPHDALFKAAFSKVRHARGLLRALVPEALGRRIEWATLRLESGIAVGDGDLDEQRMDLSVLRYILETSRVEPATLRELLAHQVGRKTAEEIMTTAEMLRREGEARGKVQGKREALLLLLRQRFDRLPASVVARIDTAAAAELDLWVCRVLTAPSLEDVLGAKLAVPPNKPMQPTRAQPSGARQRSRG